MFKRKRTQTVALGMAAVITLALLAGLDHLATQQHAGSALARGGDSAHPIVVSAGVGSRT